MKYHSHHGDIRPGVDVSHTLYLGKNTSKYVSTPEKSKISFLKLTHVSETSTRCISHWSQIS